MSDEKHKKVTSTESKNSTALPLEEAQEAEDDEQESLVMGYSQGTPITVGGDGSPMTE